MLGRDVDISFSENPCDPVNADPAPVGFQDLSLATSQGVDLGRFEKNRCIWIRIVCLGASDA
jgi:hypothetical protein